MKFGIKSGSSKEITLEDIVEIGKEKLKEPGANTTEVFIHTCYELARDKNMTAAIHLDHAFIVDDNNAMKAEEILNVKFRKEKGY